MTIVIPLVTVVMHLFLLNFIFLPKASLYNNI